MLTNLLAAYGRWVVRHRWTVLAAVLATTVLLGRAATHLRVEVDPDRQLPQYHPFIQTLTDVHRIFGDKNLVVVGLFPHDGHVFTPAFLTKLAEVTERIRRIPGANQALLQSLAAPQVKAIRGTADGMEVERVTETPPADMADAEEVRRRAFSNEAYVGTPVAAGHAVQVLKRFYEEFERSGDAGEAIVASLGRVGPVMIAAGTIAALSFCSLVSFQTATIRTFGLFTGFGIASALVIELTIIPAVRALLPAPRGREREREAAAHPWLDRMLRLAHRASRPTLARWVFGGCGVLVLLCVVLAARITVDTSYKREFGAREPVRVEDAKINARFAGTNTLVLLVEGDGEGTLEEPTIMRAIYALERRLEGEPGVGKALSYVDFVRQMHLALTADRSDQGELPGTRALTAQYLFLYSLSGGSEDFDTLIDPDHRAAKVRLLIHEDSTYFGQKLIAVAQDVVARTFPPGYRVRYTGSLASTAAATEVMVHGKIRNILQIALITFCIAALLLRSVTGGLLVATPLALTVAVNFGVMGLLGIPLDTVTSMISAMAVGIGADYAVYFLFRLREELAGGADLDAALGRALTTSGKAVRFVSSAIAVGYATLCLSGFGLHVQLGSPVARAMLVSSASALVLLPAMVARFRPAFLWSSALAAAEREEETAQAGEAWAEAEAAVV